MTASLLIPPVAKFWNIDGTPLAFGWVYTYAAGSLTNKATYQTYDTSGAQNTNPVHLDANGEANIWLDGNYKINVKDSDLVQLPNYPVDNVSSFTGSSNFYVTTGSANSYILTPSPSLLTYSAGDVFNVEFNVGNSGPSTINISNLGVKSLVIAPATALSSGNLITGVIYNIIYDGTNFQVLNPTTVATSIPIEITMGLSATAPSGRLVINGDSIGSASSGATWAASGYATLYAYWWNNVSDTYAPVTSGRGANAAADFAANKKLTMPDWAGYTPMGVKAATSITAAAMTAGALTVTSTGSVLSSGTTDGHAITTSEMPSHSHTVKYKTGSPNENNFASATAFGQNAASAVMDNRTSDGTNSNLISTAGSGSTHSHTLTSISGTYTGNATSVLQPSFGIYYYINY